MLSLCALPHNFGNPIFEQYLAKFCEMTRLVKLGVNRTQLVKIYTSGQSYKASTIVIYASRVVPDLKIPHITTLES